MKFALAALACLICSTAHASQRFTITTPVFLTVYETGGAALGGGMANVFFDMTVHSPSNLEVHALQLLGENDVVAFTIPPEDINGPEYGDVDVFFIGNSNQFLIWGIPKYRVHGNFFTEFGEADYRWGRVALVLPVGFPEPGCLWLMLGCVPMMRRARY